MKDKFLGKMIFFGYGVLVWNIIKYSNIKNKITNKNVKDALRCTNFS